MERTSLKFRALVNSVYNFSAYAWPLILTFFLTPFVVFSLGVKEYGIYLFISTVGIFINIIDLGLGMAVTKNIAFYFGEKKEAELRTLIRTANSLFLSLASIGFIAFAGIAFIGANFLPERFAEYAPYSPLFLITGLIFFVETASRAYPAILTGLQRYDTVAKFSIIIMTTSSVGTLIVVALGGGIYGIIFLQLTVSITSAIFAIVKSFKYLPLSKIGFDWNVTEIRRCYAFGLASTVHGMSGLALLHLDKLIIPFYVGPSNLTYYNMPGSISSKIPGVAGSVAGMLFPMASSLSGEENKEKLRVLYVRSLRLVTIASAAITVACISFAEPLLFYWLDAEFAKRATTVLIILAVTNFILSLSGLMSNFLLGIGKLKLLTIISFLTTILNVVLLLVLLPRFGIVGAAWAYLVSLIPLTYLFYYCEKYYLQLSKRKKYHTKQILGTVLVSVIVIVFNTFLVKPFATNLALVLAASGLSAVLYVVLYKLFGFFEKEDWDDLYLFLKKLVLSPGKRVVMNIIFNIQVFSFAIISRVYRWASSTQKKDGYNFVILCIKKTQYADLIITNINSLHYRNNAHHITVRSDKLCCDYLKKQWWRFDYPEKISLEITTDVANKGWQFFKVEEIIRAAQHDQILFDADTFWHEDIVLDRDRITLLASCGQMGDDKRDAMVLEKVFGKPEWGNFIHHVAAFVSIPQKLMTHKLANDMRMFNQKIWDSDLSFIEDERKQGEVLRLSEEFAVNLATQTNYPADTILVLKEEDGVGSKKKMESLYYGCRNEINE